MPFLPTMRRAPSRHCERMRSNTDTHRLLLWFASPTSWLAKTERGAVVSSVAATTAKSRNLLIFHSFETSPLRFASVEVTKHPSLRPRTPVIARHLCRSNPDVSVIASVSEAIQTFQYSPVCFANKLTHNDAMTEESILNCSAPFRPL